MKLIKSIKANAVVGIILLGTLPAIGQKEANNWLLGRIAGVTFKSGEPEKLTQDIRNTVSAQRTKKFSRD